MALDIEHMFNRNKALTSNPFTLKKKKKKKKRSTNVSFVNATFRNEAKEGFQS
jgi:hypothetical protein